MLPRKRKKPSHHPAPLAPAKSHYEEVSRYLHKAFWPETHVLGNDLLLVRTNNQLQLVDTHSGNIVSNSDLAEEQKNNDIKDVIRSINGSVAIRFERPLAAHRNGFQEIFAFPGVIHTSGVPYDRYIYGMDECLDQSGIKCLDLKEGSIKQVVSPETIRKDDTQSKLQAVFSRKNPRYPNLLFRLSAKQLGLYLAGIAYDNALNRCVDVIQVYNTDDFSLQKEIYLSRAAEKTWEYKTTFFAMSRNGSLATWSRGCDAEIFSQITSAQTSFANPAYPVSILYNCGRVAWSFDNDLLVREDSSPGAVYHFSAAQLRLNESSRRRPVALPFKDSEIICQKARVFRFLPNGRVLIERQAGCSLADITRHVFFNAGESTGYFRFFSQTVAPLFSKWLDADTSSIVAQYACRYIASICHTYFLRETIQDHLKLLQSPDFAKSDNVEEEKIVSKLFEMILDHSPQEIIEHIRREFPRAEEKYTFVRYIFGMMQETVNELEVQPQVSCRAVR